MRESQSIVNSIRSIVDSLVRNGARQEYQLGIVSSAGSYEISAYLQGRTDIPSDYINIYAGQYLNAGDYILVSIDEDGAASVDKIFPQSLYSKIAMDWNNGILYASGNGTAMPVNPGVAGQTLHSAGPGAPMYWG